MIKKTILILAGVVFAVIVSQLCVSYQMTNNEQARITKETKDAELQVKNIKLTIDSLTNKKNEIEKNTSIKMKELAELDKKIEDGRAKLKGIEDNMILMSKKISLSKAKLDSNNAQIAATEKTIEQINERYNGMIMNVENQVLKAKELIETQENPKVENKTEQTIQSNSESKDNQTNISVKVIAPKSTQLKDEPINLGKIISEYRSSPNNKKTI